MVQLTPEAAWLLGKSRRSGQGLVLCGDYECRQQDKSLQPVFLGIEAS
jgi:hypothetical protein